MNCGPAMEVLEALRKFKVTGTEAELGELLSEGLVVVLENWAIAGLDHLKKVWLNYGYGATPKKWDPSWLAAPLKEIDTKLRSDWHRAVSSQRTLEEEEEERLSLRKCLGLLRDAEIRERLQTAERVQAEMVQRGQTMVPLPWDPSLVIAISRFGEAAVDQYLPRKAKYEALPLSAFLRAFRKTQGRMQELAEQIDTINSGVGYLRKGKNQVVLGLIKSGLPAQEAVSAYQQAEQRVKRPGAHPTEPPHLAVTVVRQMAKTKDAAEAEQRIAEAETVLLQKGLPAGPQTRGAAKSLLGYDSLDEAAHRLLNLRDALQGYVGDDPVLLLRYATRLLPVQAAPEAVVARCKAVAQMLVEAGYARYCESAENVAVSIVSGAADANADKALVDRFVTILKQITALKGKYCNYPSVEGALALTLCPGSPEEVIATAYSLGKHLANGDSPSLQLFELACALAKRVQF